MIKDEPHICPQCDTNENSIRISDWDVKGTIFINNHIENSNDDDLLDEE